ncbi:IclR family transcriptional regulator [Paraburkholderia caballeronis]|uniref:DNA-binding transcriptional regulator, IclR family n=1 Tax=Paraburkholderia caballeronis TaxID=416943 RepID=A0A1H7SGV0_9BURK|nr:IclR family transcriptional regulator [Paraburkholderia caballeronis]PXW22284.1 IclR family transcriptional regulator [Paraburkholderia caballeronis]PXW95943.1 IclR family transcriptional regulator [Paraburkholderia caballeronis]RAJ92309.1 IclR family transcriptional regulator [Paraburkholderia caballeronis]TDV08124.1 IclR family transcriptional regulator [Paraburkholderia caballeronis]TDV11812.1 IclR family transcriptional regulator [Paraburkholderia caballeronis]
MNHGSKLAAAFEPARLDPERRRDGAADRNRDQNRDRSFVTALARGLELLRCFTPATRQLGLSELARRSGLPKATVSRLAGTLAQLGYLKYEPANRRYSVGIGVLSLGYAALSNVDIREIARPLMHELAEHALCSVAIGVRDRLSIVYVEWVPSRAPITVMRGIGAHLPIATTSIGRAYLAAASDAERNAVLDQLRGDSACDWPQIRRGIEDARRDYVERGFCVSIGDWEDGIASVGVPFTAPDGTPMAFNCGGPAFVLDRERLEHDIGPRLVAMVRDVGAAVGRG